MQLNKPMDVEGKKKKVSGNDSVRAMEVTANDEDKQSQATIFSHVNNLPIQKTNKYCLDRLCNTKNCVSKCLCISYTEKKMLTQNFENRDEAFVTNTKNQ